MLLSGIAELFLAQAEANPQGAAQGGSGQPPPDPMAFFKQILLFVVPMIFFFWLLVFRPEGKKRKERERLLSGVKKGDTVVTSSGVIGKVWRVEDKEVTLVIDKDKDVKAHFLKSAISDVLQAEPAVGSA